MRLDGQTAIVTGASSGIGRATAARLAALGARVTAVDIGDPVLPEGTGHAFVPCDVASEDQVRACVDDTVARTGRIDILCNNAGILGGLNPITEDDIAGWQAVLSVNLIGAAAFIKYAGRVMQDRCKGAIVNTASVAGIRSGAGGSAYSASKAALINLTQTAACDLGGYGIRVNAVCPGLIETGMTAPVFDAARAAGKEDRLGARAELRRYGTPEDVAAAITFLASDDARFITGQALAVDGGNTASLNLPGMKM